MELSNIEQLINEFSSKTPQLSHQDLGGSLYRRVFPMKMLKLKKLTVQRHSHSSNRGMKAQESKYDNEKKEIVNIIEINLYLIFYIILKAIFLYIVLD